MNGKLCGHLHDVVGLLVSNLEIFFEKRESGLVRRGNHDLCTCLKVSLVSVFDHMGSIDKILCSPKGMIEFVIAKFPDGVLHATVENS